MMHFQIQIANSASTSFLGTSFCALKDDMTKVYAPYCRNHDDAIGLLEKVCSIVLISMHFIFSLRIHQQNVSLLLFPKGYTCKQ